VGGAVLRAPRVLRGHNRAGAEAGGPCSVLRDFSGLGLATDEGGDE
jgi:hypothetical protein